MRTGIGGGGRLEYALDHGTGAILADGNLFTRQYADVFAAYRAGKDYHAPLAKLRDQEKLLRDGDVNSYGPMKYALSLQMGNRQTYQRAAQCGCHGRAKSRDPAWSGTDQGNGLKRAGGGSNAATLFPGLPGLMS